MSAALQITEQTTVILVPKNRGLATQAAAALAELAPEAAERTVVRGEDVAALANSAARAGRSVFALTGEDLLDEWLANGNELDPSLIRKQRRWTDSQAIYGAPALCAIATSPDVFDRKVVRVAVCSRYARISEPYLADLEARGTTLERAYYQGALETIVTSGLADAAIDIVVTGNSVRNASLEIVNVISLSNLAILETR